MPFGNLFLSILSASICYLLLWNSSSNLYSAAFLLGGLSVWQFYCESSGLYGYPNVEGNPVVFRFGRFIWRQSEACRHWFVSGETGTGKTFFFRRIIWQLCDNISNWGGLVLDEKGTFVEILRGIFMNHPKKSESDLVVLEVRGDQTSED